jgi:hypothetical protein
LQVVIHGDYDALDAMAKKRGYNSVECSNDDRIVERGEVGFQNGNLHCGWIATWSETGTKALDQLELLKEKLIECEKRKEVVIVGFCQTGNFSIGYSIYRKE